MGRMKTFFRYFLLFVLFYIFSNIMIYLNIRSSMQEIKSSEIEFQNPQIIIEEAKASKVNAVIKGKIKKDQTVQYKYIRVDLLSERGNVLNSKFIDISELEDGKEEEFSIRTNTEDVKGYKLVLTDIKEIKDIDIQMEEISEALMGAFLVFLLIY